MSLSQGNQILWNDIKSVMTNIKDARTKMGYDTASITNLINGAIPDKAYAGLISTLYDQINECRNRTVAANDSTVSANYPNATPPNVGDLITLKQTTAMNNMANQIKTLNFAYFSSCFGFWFDTGGFSFTFNYY